MDFSVIPAQNLIQFSTAEEAVAHIEKIYSDNVRIMNDQYNALINGEAVADQRNGYYPYVAIKIGIENLNIDSRLAFGVAIDPGVYGTTVTNPKIFKQYYHEQFTSIIQHHGVTIYVGESFEAIPLPFIERDNSVAIDQQQAALIHSCFASPDLTRINDDIANNKLQFYNNDILPMALFSAERVDYSLHRLHHYTGTSAHHFQGFILLTNYQRYVNEFIEYAQNQLNQDSIYTSFVMPGDFEQHHINSGKESQGQATEHLPQMPAYHLKCADGQGITFINIGVGPSNAKTITDHLAVLRPHCWIMLGHCAGLRRSQLLGDYVLAHAYVRDDHVLDFDLPVSTPIPTIAEVQTALQDAVENITGEHGHDMKSRMRTGSVLTTDNRNWELSFVDLFGVFQQSRAIAVDMESATIAANGFRFRVPYGTLLCISDKPIHGELKLRSSANSFYQQSILQHLKIGIEAVNLLRQRSVNTLHSRKLRGFAEPPMR